MDNVLLNLRRFLSPEIIIGNGAMVLVGHHASNLSAQKVLLVSDHGVAAAGLTKRVQSSLEEQNIAYTTFLDVSENPKDTEVYKGLHQYQESACDLIIAVGGGSAMDCAKAIGILATNKGKITDFVGINKIPLPLPPLIFLPTTAGSSSDVSQVAIITISKERKKVGIMSTMIMPDISLIDPEATLSLPMDITCFTAMDTLCHAYEAYVSRAASRISDISSLEAFKIIFNEFPKLLEQPYNLDIRADIVSASTLAGFAFSNVGVGIAHSLSHAIGGFYDTNHGECTAILLEKVIAYNYQSRPNKHMEIGRALNLPMDQIKEEDRPTAISNCIRKFRLDLGITKTVKDLGLEEKQIKLLAARAIKDISTVTNPKVSTIKDLEELLYQLL